MLIPIYTPDGRLLGNFAQDIVIANARHFRLVFNRRGHLKRAYEKTESLDRRPGSRVGLPYEQPLSPGGHVWALRGVRGSDR
jgi:hypothetical protein